MSKQLTYEEDLVKTLIDYVRGHKSKNHFYGIYRGFQHLSSITQSKYPPLKNHNYYTLNLEWDNVYHRYNYEFEYKANGKGENVTININFFIFDKTVYVNTWSLDIDHNIMSYITLRSREIQYVNWNYKPPTENRIAVCTNCKHKHELDYICDAVKDWINDDYPIYCKCVYFTNFISDFFRRIELE